MIRSLVMMLILCFIAGQASAISIEDAIRHALEHSEAIRMSMEASNMMQAQAGKVSAFTEPQLALNAGYTEMGTTREDSPFDFLNPPDRNLSIGISGSQVFYAGGRITHSRELKKELLQRSDLVRQEGRRDVIHHVRRVFDAVLYQEARINILKDRVRQREVEQDDARDLHEAGMVTSLDVRQAKLSLNFARDELASGEASYRESMINFNLAIGNSASDSPLIPEGQLEIIPDTAEIMANMERLHREDNLLDIQAAISEFESANLDAEIRRGQKLPELALVTSGTSEGEDLDEMNESWNIGLQLRWTLLDGGIIHSGYREAMAQKRHADENLKRIRKRLAGDIETIRINLESLEQRIRLQQESVELSGKNYEDARGHYRAGTITLTRLGEFNLSFAEARFNLLRLFYLQRDWINTALNLIAEDVRN